MKKIQDYLKEQDEENQNASETEVDEKPKLADSQYARTISVLLNKKFGANIERKLNIEFTIFSAPSSKVLAGGQVILSRENESINTTKGEFVSDSIIALYFIKDGLMFAASVKDGVVKAVPLLLKENNRVIEPQVQLTADEFINSLQKNNNVKQEDEPEQKAETEL